MRAIVKAMSMPVVSTVTAAAAAALAVLLLAAAPLAAAEAGAAADSGVGMVVEAVRQVTGTPAGGSPAPLDVGSPVLLDMTVATGRASSALMTLDPDGSLALGPEARVVVDQATVDQATGAADTLLGVLVGKIRLALSSAFRGEIEIDTPTATIGIKGTTLAVEVDGRGDTVVWVLEGVVEVLSKAGGDTVRLAAGQLSTVSRGRPATGPTPFDEETGAAAARVLPPELAGPEEDAFDDSPLPSPIDQELPPRGPNDPRDPAAGPGAQSGGTAGYADDKPPPSSRGPGG